uniref:C-type lectin domain-containing protein n=1 Tax=Denticeps clupeoides TaxID=299321 RepID=A0AAY4DHW1_9TELE
RGGKKICLLKHVLLSSVPGFLIFSACSPYQYIMISNIMTWYDAQNYCRTKYIDLATIENLDDDNTIFSLATNQGYTGWFWIGLYNDINSWRWSLNDSNFYTQSNVQYRNWGSGQPDNYQGHQACARMLSDGSWDDLNCEEVIPFICYGASVGRTTKTWPA